MDEGVVRYYFKQLCEAVNYLHMQDICHRDLKLENLLLDNNFNLKVSDFGFCTEITNQIGERIHMTCKGTPGYMAPEMMNLNGFNYVKNQKCHRLFSSNGYNGVQTDIFALGVILFGMVMGRPPFKIADIDDPFYRMIFCHQYEEFWQPWDSFAEQCNTEISADFKELFISMVEFNPILRISINEILACKWMRRETPSKNQVTKYMASIKIKIEEFEDQQRIYIENMLKNKMGENKPIIEETKEECYSEENLNESYLSASSQIKDDDDQIMKDLEEIEREFGEFNEKESTCFNLCDNDFDLGNDCCDTESHLLDNEAICLDMETSLM